MIKLAKKKWNIDTKNSLLIGDQDTDKLTAINAGIKYKGSFEVLKTYLGNVFLHDNIRRGRDFR